MPGITSSPPPTRLIEENFFDPWWRYQTASFETICAGSFSTMTLSESGWSGFAGGGTTWVMPTAERPAAKVLASSSEARAAGVALLGRAKSGSRESSFSKACVDMVGFWASLAISPSSR